MRQRQSVIRSLEAVTGALIGILTACGVSESDGRTRAARGTDVTGPGGIGTGGSSTGTTGTGITGTTT
jgi:hypothetical protein